MKRFVLYCFVLYGAISMYSFSGVFGRPATGAPGETGATCGQGGCHAAGNFSPSLSFSLTDSNGDLVTSYVAGDQYTVSLKANHTGLPSGYGFQIVCLDASDEPINNFSDLPDNTQEFENSGRQYIEQSSTLPVDSIPLTWTAPAGGGAVTFYGIVNVVNGNGGTAGDGAANGSFTVEENLSSTDDLASLNVQVYPNPTQDFIHVPSDIVVKEMSIFNISGKMIQSVEDNSMSIAQLESGQYLLKIIDNNNKTYTEQIQKI